MKKGLMELVFILDRSGSMEGLEGDTIGGYNSVINKQKAQEGSAIVTTILFDDKYEILHDRINLNALMPVTESEYYVRGSTALLDAIGMTIEKILSVQKQTLKSEWAEKVLFIIITDGYDNASTKFNYDAIKRLVSRQREMEAWEFVFMGANIDAIQTANRFGVHKDYAVNYKADPKGTFKTYEAVSEAVTMMRSDMPVSSSWKEAVEEDFKHRKDL